MKRIKIEAEKLPLLASLYDEGFELFYSPEAEEAFMINEVIESAEFTNISTSRDTVVILEVSEVFDSLLDGVHLYNSTRKLTFSRTTVQNNLTMAERRLVNILSIPTTIFSVSRLASAKEPHKKFIVVEFQHGLKNKEGEEASTESIISVLKKMEGDVYIHQVGKNCKKKVQKKV